MRHERSMIIYLIEKWHGGIIVSESVPLMVLGEVGGEVSDERVEGPSTKELYSMLPLVGANQFGVCNDLDRCRLKTFIQLIQSKLLALLEHAVELIQVGGRLRNLADIVMESVRVLDGQGDCVVLILEFGVEVLPLHPKFPCLPGTTAIGLIHSLIQCTTGGLD